jgi:TonB family protein
MRQADATVYESKEPGITLPVVVQRVNAKYTDDARKRGVQGIIELEEVVTSTGDVREDVRVVKSLDPELDAQAVDAARQWHFRPGTKDGKPVNVRVHLEMSFRLQ